MDEVFFVRNLTAFQNFFLSYGLRLCLCARLAFLSMVVTLFLIILYFRFMSKFPVRFALLNRWFRFWIAWVIFFDSQGKFLRVGKVGIALASLSDLC